MSGGCEGEGEGGRGGCKREVKKEREKGVESSGVTDLVGEPIDQTKEFWGL